MPSFCNFIIFGSNTNVGKTIVSTLLATKFNYIKPIQTGTETDQNFIKRFAMHQSLKTLYSFKNPLSPNLAAEGNRKTSDEELIGRIKSELGHHTIIETAGGVNTPVISGNLQSNVLKALSLPAILIGDSKLGGISATLSAYESLKLRGYDIPMIVLFENQDLNNEDTIKLHLGDTSNVETVIKTLEHPPDKNEDFEIDTKNLKDYFERNRHKVNEMVSVLNSFSTKRIQRLQYLQENGEKSIWWPFTQHDLVKYPMVIDSAFKSNLNVYSNSAGNSSKLNENDFAQQGSVRGIFDGCASWWTNGLGHGNVKLAKAAAYASGRYGHVIAPEALHEPMVALAEKLISTCGKNWAEKCFYSDNGSTAVEVAVKMAFTRSELDLKNAENNHDASKTVDPKEFKIIGLRNSYHGDTIGAMDLSDPNVYNKKVHWYSGRGFWLDPPTLAFKNGENVLNIPSSWNFVDKRPEIYYNSPILSQIYKAQIVKSLKEAVNDGYLFGALVIEPLILGAGGMLFIDPLYQKTLVEVVRQPDLWGSLISIPVIYDEIFVGMYRCGKDLASVSSILGEVPDIACYAKCLTGGLIPLAVTLTTERVFEAFRGDSKLSALLHGHSYTAHPVGCQVALQSLDEYARLSNDAERGVWNSTKVDQLSYHKSVERVNCLGTVLVVELKSKSAGGYLDTTSKEFLTILKARFGVFARPLEDEIYCGEHLPKGRIPCPLNPKHFVKEEDLESHLKFKCEKRLIITDYYHKDYNSGPIQEQVGFSIENLREAIYRDPSLLEKVQSISFDKVYQESILEHPSMKERVLDCKIGKHARQQSSLLANLEKLGLLDEDFNYLEFGCGHAELTKFLSLTHLTTHKMFLIDRKKSKLKADYDYKQRNYERVLIDIRHLNLAKVSQSLERSGVVYSKHLCGVATDLTLRCLRNFQKSGGSIKGIVIALCCHAVCNYDDYINPEYLRDMGIGRDEFELLKCISGWAVSGVPKAGLPEKVHWSGLDFKQREELGYKCKRILDEGRVEYCLTELNASSCDLKYYVSREYSKENAILVAQFGNRA